MSVRFPVSPAASAVPAGPASDVRVTRLDNGLRVVTDLMPHVETAAVGVWVDVGARHETPRQNGVSHLLEHMAFKGTERRSARAIAEEIEAVGGHLNAYTSREHTAYYARILVEDVPLAVDILADILQHSVFEEGELARERDVVVQEIGQTEDTPDDVIFDRFQEAAYPDQPLGRSILGTVERVSGFGAADLRGYMGANYTAPRMVLAAAGRVDHDALVEAATAGFAKLAITAGAPAEAARFAAGDYRESRDLEQVHFLIGFEGVAHGDPDYYTSHVLSTLLGGGMSSRLFQEIRERRGLAYSVSSFGASYVDGGLFGIYAGTGEDQVPDLVAVTCDEVMKVTQAVSDEEVKRARAQIKAGMLMSLESPSSRCERVARHLLVFGKPLPLDEIVARIDAVDAEAVARLARRLFAGRPPVVAALGPIGALEPYDRIAGRLN